MYNQFLILRLFTVLHGGIITEFITVSILLCGLLPAFVLL